ncbi:MAG: hypothetical protein M3122_09295 [Actinomycetota bacterium]|nr:hypothetical protein [Actinomycetota bacterium]
MKIQDALRHTKRPGLRVTAVGMIGLGVVIALLPLLSETDTLAEFVSAYIIVLFFTGTFLYGLLVLAADVTTQRLLLLKAATGGAGMAATYLGGRPETLVEGPAALPLTLLFLADTLRMGAAVCVGLTLARRVTSPGVALLIAGLATAANLYSFLAGPTQTPVEGGPDGGPSLFGYLLGYLLVWFPTFGFPLGFPLGFALGIGDFIFLALFAATSGYLHLHHPLPILVLGCVAVLVAILTGLLLETALPFVALSFLAANALPLYRSL